MVFLALTPGLPLLGYAFSQAPSVFGGVVHLVVAALFFVASFNAKRLRLNPEAQSGMTFREKSAVTTLCRDGVRLRQLLLQDLERNARGCHTDLHRFRRAHRDHSGHRPHLDCG
jgi:hypothetical protein